jgi:hypothetical protein
MTLFNFPLWRSGLDAHQSWGYPYIFFSVTYVFLVLKSKARSRRIEEERKRETKL